MSKQKRLSNPFPGLRPFEPHENHLFFGRDGQSDELLRRLGQNRFLAVVGTSGSGKSSLVRAGLLPILHGGFMEGGGSHWRVAVFRPGADPIGNLAATLSQPGLLREENASEEDNQAPVQTAITEAALRRGSPGLVEVVRQARLPGGENLLLVVDQFEELFRFKDSTSVEKAGDEAAAFVKLLLRAVGQAEIPIYIAITMRSDFLGDCARFRNLPEAINDSQYLIPRMTRDQRREAITGPVAVGGAEISPRLIQRLLNDVGDNPDQLPILQHALMRTWDYWQDIGKEGEPLDVKHYESIGGMAEALNRHADEAFAELGRRQRQGDGQRCRELAQKLFRSITELGHDNREVRRPTLLKDVCRIVGAGVEEMKPVIDMFRRKGRSFLMPPKGTALDGDSLIDISHESLIRQWKRLREWVIKEAEDREMYERIAGAAQRYEENKGGLLHDPDLQFALDWQAKSYNQAWAQRCLPDYKLDKALEFLEKSKKKRDDDIEKEKERQKQELKRTRTFTAILSAALIISIFVGYFAWQQRDEAWKQRDKAQQKTYDANYNLAKVFEEKAGIELDKDKKDGINYQKAWLYTLAALKLDIGPKHLPDSFGRLMIPGIFNGTYEQIWISPKSEGHSGTVYGVAFSPDGKRLASGANNEIYLWDVQSGTQLKKRVGHSGSITSLAFSPDEKWLALGSKDGTISLWDFQTWEPFATLVKHKKAVTSLAFSPNGKSLASAANYEFYLWEVQSQGQPVKLPRYSSSITSLAFSPDGRWLASGYKEIYLKNLQNENLKRKRVGFSSSDFIFSLAFSPDGKWLAAAGFKAIYLKEVQSEEPPVKLVGHSGSITSLAFSPDGKRLASGATDKTVRLWDVWSGKPLPKPERPSYSEIHSSMVYSPDGKWRASCAGENIYLQDIKSGKPAEELVGHSGSTTNLAFSPDGKRLASGAGKELCLWDVRSRKLLVKLKGYPIHIRILVFSPDGKHLVLGSGLKNETVHWWDINYLNYFGLSGKRSPLFKKIYQAAFDISPYKFEGLKLVLKKPDEYQHSLPSRPLDKTPVEWILENLKED